MQAKRHYELTDAQWARLEPLLPPEKPGRPNDDHRRILNGILWVLNSGAPWRDLPRRYGRVGTVSSRFYRWRRSDVWQRVLEALQADAEERVGWELHFLDSTVVRAHQHAAGARKAGREPGAEDEALGRSRGGFTTKIHVRCEGYGKPVTFTLTEVHDSQQVTALIDRGAIRRIGRGQPRLRPAKLAGDNSSRSIRFALRKRGITPVIPTKSGVSPTLTARHTGNATSSSA
jgi:transposase